MISIAESARLTAELASTDKAPGPFVALRMSQSEEDAESVITSFSVVQPPGERADVLRRELLQVMDEVSSVITRARIEARRGQLEGLEDTSEPLDELVRGLEDFVRLGQT